MGDFASIPKTDGPPDESIKELGCTHYKRKCKFVVSNIKINWLFNLNVISLQSPCCGKIYVCRFCHDENENHVINRKEIKEVVCAVCELQQPIQANCEKCGALFGNVGLNVQSLTSLLISLISSIHV